MYFRLPKNILSPAKFIAISALIALFSSVCIADLRLNADWEYGNLLGYYSMTSGNANGSQIVDNFTIDNPVCTGNKSLKSTLEYGKGYRSEIVINQDPFNSLEMKRRHWFSFAIYLPNDYAPDSKEEVLWQMHARPDKDAGELYRNPPLAIRTKNNEWIVSYIKDSRYVTYKSGDISKKYEESGARIIGTVETGKWTTFVIDTLWDYSSTGYLKLWKDGVVVFEKTNGIGFNDTKGPYVKMGIYKRGWDPEKSWGGPSDVSSRTTYIDDFKIGNAYATYEEMVPQCIPTGSSVLTVIEPPSGLNFSVK